MSMSRSVWGYLLSPSSHATLSLDFTSLFMPPWPSAGVNDINWLISRFLDAKKWKKKILLFTFVKNCWHSGRCAWRLCVLDSSELEQRVWCETRAPCQAGGSVLSGRVGRKGSTGGLHLGVLNIYLIAVTRTKRIELLKTEYLMYLYHIWFQKSLKIVRIKYDKI